MKNMFLFISHQLNSAQIDDAKASFGVSDFISLPNDLQSVWSSVPPHLDDLSEFLRPFCEFLGTQAQKGDICMIQGDFGASYHMINFAKTLGLIPVYATTERKTIEEISGESVIKKSVFKHIIFREYR